MKDNTEKAKILLSQALMNLPDDFALSEAKFYMKVAMQKIQEVESKRAKRQVVQEQEDHRRKQNSVMNPYLQGTLDVIDNMIAMEHQKLEEIKNNKNRPKIDDDFDETGETLFG